LREVTGAGVSSTRVLIKVALPMTGGAGGAGGGGGAGGAGGSGGSGGSGGGGGSSLPTNPTQVLHTEATFINRIAVDDTHVYFSTGDAIRRVSIDGGTVETVVDGLDAPGHVAVTDTHIYWSADGTASPVWSLWRAPK
jgi:hypothetical protein